MSQESIQYNLISNFYKSFSGTDTLVFILMPGSNPVILGSITTVSYSQYRTKQPVINLGRTNINGVTRGTRIYAGTMIFTLINQHWLNELSANESLKWLSTYEELKTDELPLFDLMIVSANEYGSYVSMFIYGVDITDEGQVISVEDLFTENTLSFIARDVSTFKAGNLSSARTTYKLPEINNVTVSNFYIAGNSIDVTALSREAKNDIEEYNISLLNAQIEKMKTNLEIKERKQQLKGFYRELQYKPFDMMVGNDVGLIQTKLKQWDFLDFINYLYDKTTENAVKRFQSFIGLKITGVVDAKTYVALNSSSDNNNIITGIVINESGTRVYDFPNIYSSIIDTIPYNTMIEIHDKIQENSFTNPVTKEVVSASGHEFYQIEEGYVVVSDIYSYEYTNKDIAFPTINTYETGPYVTLMQDLLVQIYGEFDYSSGTYDDSTIEKIKEIQTKSNINCILGVVNEETWRLLHAKTGNLITDIVNNNVSVKSNNAQGRYNLNSLDMNTDLFKGFDTTINSPKNTSVKCCAIAYYDNDNTKTITRSYAVNANIPVTVSFSEFQNLFTYSIKDGFPHKVEYIIYPFNSDSYKWIINYRGE